MDNPPWHDHTQKSHIETIATTKLISTWFQGATLQLLATQLKRQNFNSLAFLHLSLLCRTIINAILHIIVTQHSSLFLFSAQVRRGTCFRPSYVRLPSSLVTRNCEFISSVVLMPFCTHSVSVIPTIIVIKQLLKDMWQIPCFDSGIGGCVSTSCYELLCIARG